MVDEQCSLVCGGLYIGADCESSGIHINMDSRFSVLYKKVGQEWQVIHLHQSVPNPEQLDGEYYPRTLTQRSRETIEHLTRLAQRDSLTGLINFNTLQSFYTDLDKHSVWMFVVDMDDFKAINDTHGHLAGNHVLKRVASLLTSTMRAQDLMRRCSCPRCRSCRRGARMDRNFHWRQPHPQRRLPGNRLQTGGSGPLSGQGRRQKSGLHSLKRSFPDFFETQQNTPPDRLVPIRRCVLFFTAGRPATAGAPRADPGSSGCTVCGSPHPAGQYPAPSPSLLRPHDRHAHR